MPDSYRIVINKMLNRLAEADQPLPDYLELFRNALIAQGKIKQADSLSSEVMLNAKKRLDSGKPALTFDDLIIDWNEFQQIFVEIFRLAEGHGHVDVSESGKLEKMAGDPVFLKQQAQDWFESTTVTNRTDAVCNHSGLFSLFQASMMPILADHAGHIISLINQESWHRNYCPACGGSADFAYLDKERGSRWLMCSRCNTGWLFQRLHCPYCNNDDMGRLSYFTDDRGLYRLYVCDVCRGYIKAIDLRKAESEVLFPLERVMTFDLDKQAIESGYKAD